MENLRKVEVTVKKMQYGENEPSKSVTTILTGSFHGWEDYKDEDYSCKYAIVELEDGTVHKYLPDAIRFKSTKELFKEVLEKRYGQGEV